MRLPLLATLNQSRATLLAGSTLLCVASGVPLLLAQGPTENELPVARFEVASIRRSTDLTGQTGLRPTNAGRLSGLVTVRALVQVAYGYPDALFTSQVVGGPEWIDRDRFELTASFEGPVSAVPGGPPLRLLAMLRALLSDRFHLQVRREARQMDVYDLVLDREDGSLGTRLTRASGTCLPISSSTGPITDFSRYCGFRRATPVETVAQGTSMASLARSLSFLPDVQRVVRDFTGLSGDFDFAMDYSSGHANGDPGVPPSVFTALREQLGLRLRAATGPVDVVVIDRVEPPTPN